MRGEEDGLIRRATSRRRGSVSALLVTDEDEVREFTVVTTEQELDPEGTGTFFGNLHLSPNGGLYEVGGLYNPLRYLGATIFVSVLVLNVRSVCVRALAAITSDTEPQAFLTHERLLQRLAPHHQLTPQAVVAWFELVCLVVFILQILGDLRTILFSRRRDPGEEYRYWRKVSHLLKDVLPGLQSFSAMKVLKFITPPVLNADLQMLIREFRTFRRHKSGAYKLFAFGRFILQRLFLFAFGFEAFLMKFRDVAGGLSGLPGAEFRAAFRLLIFLNQMLGIVQLNMFANERLFRFIFGGVDNFIDPSEHKKMCVWRAALMRRIWDEFKASPSKFFAVAITFNDVDFQRLVLDDDGGKAEVDSPGWYTVLHDGASVTDGVSVTSGIRARLGSGTRMKVLEVLDVDHRVRARIENPTGWISLVSRKTGYRWASRQAT